MSNPIERSLAYEDDHQHRRIIGQEEVAAIVQPVVVLGDPGLGKSFLARSLGVQPGMKYCRAGTFDRTDRPETLIARGERIIVDGLDEIASSTPGGAVDTVLRQLSRMGSPPFILTCRAADWNGAADRTQIEDDYGSAPVLLHLQPFSHDDARLFLSNEFPAIDAAGIVYHLASRGLDDICQNPLTLRLLGEVAHQTGPLPERRAELLERACRVMLTEENPRHHDDSHVHRSDEELLLAAGAICATLVLCARSGAYTGPYADTPDDCVHVADVAALPFGAFAEDVLQTRLFSADGENRSTHVHRVVAEYLGAKWLAACFDSGRSERRIFSLFRPGDGVPTSLRGLHAWLAHFSAALAPRCIAADPYAVLRYGDAETINVDQARSLLAALANLSEDDPYFAAEDWGRHPASGLMHTELKEEILALLSGSERNPHFSIILLVAMAGTPLASELAHALTAMMFDQNRPVDERSSAADALQTTNTIDDWEAVIRRLLAMGDSDSATLACDLLADIGTQKVSVYTAVDAVLGSLRISVSDVPRSAALVTRDIPDDLFSGVDTNYVGNLLDQIASSAPPLMDGADFSAASEMADLVRRLVSEFLDSDPRVEPHRVWAWIGWLDGMAGYTHCNKRRLARRLRENRVLRAALLEHVLLTPRAEDTWMAAWRLDDTDLGLFPTHEDLASLLHALSARSADGSMDDETWGQLVRLGRTPAGIGGVVQEAALETANGNAALLAILDAVSRDLRPERRARQAQLEERAEARVQAFCRAHRAHLANHPHAVAAGDIQLLAVPAEVYLGRSHELFDSSISPEARLCELLGAPLVDQALAGFVAVLQRNDLPSAAAIADIHCRQGRFCAEEPMICGVAEMLRQGRPLDAIDRATLSAVYLAWKRAPESGTDGALTMDAALEEALFRSERDIETHFRTSIEPQLAARREWVEELDRLTHDARWSRLAGRLAAEWLATHWNLPLPIQAELLSCALDNCPEQIANHLKDAERMDGAHDRDTTLLWLSAAFVADFGNQREELHAVAADDIGLLWFVRDRMGGEDRTGEGLPERFKRFSTDQLVFVVEAFGVNWPRVAMPTGVITGNQVPWDACKFIERTIHAISSRPTPDATEALRRLIDGPATSYAETARHALALHRRARRDFEYTAPSVREVQAVLTDDLPETIDDMRAFIADCLDALQERMHASNTDMWEAYWTEESPREEEYCRNRLVDQLAGLMPEAIRLEPEMRMPERRRADIVAIRNAVGLPVEIKGQWHREVWDAASDQLDAYYAREWHAQGRGVYLVLWFGDVPGKQLPGHPEQRERPQTPRMLRRMLIDRLPEARRLQIDVFVLDVTRPAGTA